MKRKKFLTPVLFCAVFGLFTVFCVFWVFYIINNQPIGKCFTDISHFDKLKPYITDTLSPEDDKHLDGLGYSDSFCCTVKYNGGKYEVFAYVFNDVASAHQYFCNITDQDREVVNHRMKQYTGDSCELPFDHAYSYKYFVSNYAYSYYENCAYYIRGYGDHNGLVELVAWLTEDFEIDMDNLTIPDYIASKRTEQIS